MIDLDHFKQINDSAATTPAIVRSPSSPARCRRRCGRAISWRYGGEEFCVLMAMPTTRSERVRRPHAHYLTEVAEQELGFPLAYSAGIAMRNSAEDTLAAMVKRADAMLYAAKEQGRSRTLDAQGLRLRSA